MVARRISALTPPGRDDTCFYHVNGRPIFGEHDQLDPAVPGEVAFQRWYRQTMRPEAAAIAQRLYDNKDISNVAIRGTGIGVEFVSPRCKDGAEESVLSALQAQVGEDVELSIAYRIKLPLGEAAVKPVDL